MPKPVGVKLDPGTAVHDANVVQPPVQPKTPDPSGKTKPVGDGFARTSGHKSKLDATPKSQGAPDLTRSAKLLDLMLAADKTSFVEGLQQDEAGALLERAVAKRVAQLLLTSPYAAPRAVILRRVAEDPLVAAHYPSLRWQDLELLHERFPTIVPDPKVPVDLGATFSPTPEGYLDVLVSICLQASGRREQVATNYRDPSIADKRRYFPDRYRVFDESSFPKRYVIQDRARQFTRLNSGGHFEEVMLRRVILNALPTWGPEEIAAEFNRYLDYYAPLIWYGDNDSLAQARERATMTGERVRGLMDRHPELSGAAELAARQKVLRTTLAGALAAAKPGDNLYATLQKVCDQLETPTQAPRRSYHPDAPASLIFDVPPSANATVTPEDLARLLAADQAFSEPLARLLGDRQAQYYRTLAEEIVEKVGGRLKGASVSEIVTVMRHHDEVYNEPLVRHLLGSFPDLFSTMPVERSKAEINFLLATQVADAMDNMFVGATLDDVAKFLRASARGFAELYPDFSADDIRLLQQAYPILPQWETRPEGAATTSTGRMTLDELLNLTTLVFPVESGKELKAVVLRSLSDGLTREKVPDELRAYLDTAFARDALDIVAQELGVKRLQAWSNPERMRAYQEFLAQTPDAPRLTEKDLLVILADRDLFGLPAETASGYARALKQAQTLDVVGLRQTLCEVLKGKASAATTQTQLTALALGHRALLSQIELDIFRNKELKASFQRFARIPLRLPMVQTVVDKYQTEHPFANTNVLLVQHMLGQAYPQISGYKQLGMNPEQAIFVGIPYHKNDEVETAVARSFGIDVRVPSKDMDALYAAIEQAVDDLVAKHKENGQPCLIVCDGPHARNYFKERWLKEDPSLADKVRFTEQTAFGDRAQHRTDQSMRVVSYARTELKGNEARFVGQSVARAVSAVLNQLATGYEEKPVMILGGGSIGRATAAAFKGDRANVYMYDPNITAELEQWAQENGVTLVREKKELLKNKFLLVGCSGYCSIDEQEILDSDPGSIYVSASSKLVEINMRKLKELATDEEGRLRRVLAAEVNDQQTWHYWLKDGTIRTVIADGLPANFNDLNVVPPEFIDMTMALSIAAAVQAMRGDACVFESLNAADHDLLADYFERFLASLR